MRKILFVISNMGFGGAERVMSLLANKGAADGLQIGLALLSKDDVKYELSDNIQIFPLSRRLPVGKIQTAFARFFRLRKCIQAYKPDVVVSFMTTCNMYACLAGIGLHLPVIISERNDPIRDCPSKIRRIVRNLSYTLADGCIFQTEDARNCFSKVIQKKSVIIPNPVKNDLPFAQITQREKTVVAAARLNRQKNYPMMIEAFRIFHLNDPQYTLHIFGDGEERETLETLVVDRGMTDYVVFEGVQKDLHDRITRAGMFALSSDYEGISNSLLESMAMGLPCISTDCPCGGSRHLIRDGENGLLVPVGDANKMAEAMHQIATSEDLALRLGGNAQQVRKTHSEEKILKEYYTFFRKNVLQNKR